MAAGPHYLTVLGSKYIQVCVQIRAVKTESIPEIAQVQPSAKA